MYMTDIDITAEENKETPAFIPDSMRRQHENPLNLGRCRAVVARPQASERSVRLRYHR